MGMEFPEAEKIDPVAERAAAEAAAIKAKEDAEKDSYTELGVIYLQNKLYQLLVGIKDNRWYKAEKIGEMRIDEKNHSPLIPVFSDKVEQFSEEDQKYFDSSNWKK